MEEEGNMTNGDSEHSGNNGDTDNDPVCESDKTVTPKSGKSSKRKSKSKSKGKSRREKSEKAALEESAKSKKKAEKELSREKIVNQLEKFGLTGLIICGELIAAANTEEGSCCHGETAGGKSEGSEKTETVADSACGSDCDNTDRLVCCAGNESCVNNNSVTMGDTESKESKKQVSDTAADSTDVGHSVDDVTDGENDVGHEFKRKLDEAERADEDRGEQNNDDHSKSNEIEKVEECSTCDTGSADEGTHDVDDRDMTEEKMPSEAGNIKTDSHAKQANAGEETDKCADCDTEEVKKTDEEIENGLTNMSTCDTKDINEDICTDNGSNVQEVTDDNVSTNIEEKEDDTENVNTEEIVCCKVEEISDNAIVEVKDTCYIDSPGETGEAEMISDGIELEKNIPCSTEKGDDENEPEEKDENENVGKICLTEEENNDGETIVLSDKEMSIEVENNDGTTKQHKNLSQSLENQGNDNTETVSSLGGSIHTADMAVQTDEYTKDRLDAAVNTETTEATDDNVSDSHDDTVELLGTEQEWDQVMGLLETSQAELEEVTAKGEIQQVQTDNTEEEEKKKEEEKMRAAAERQKLEDEVERLKTELASAKSDLQKSQSLNRTQQGEHNRTVMTLKRQLYRQQVSLRKQREQSDQQLGDVMAHLLLLEGQLKKEQQCLRRDMQMKDELISSQGREVMTLRNQNEQLLNAIQEICAKGGMNGYLRDKKKRSGSVSEGSDNGGKHSIDKKDKKGGNSNGKLGSVRDKLLWKNRSSLELNNFNLEKYLIKSERLCTSQEDLQNIGKDKDKGVPNGNNGSMGNGIRPESRLRCHSESVGNRHSLNANSPRNSISSPRHSQNFFNESDYDNMDMNKSTSESSQLSENSSGVFSMSDQDIHDSYSGHHGNDSYYDEDEGHFSFSSTHINMAIAEEDVMGPVVSHTGQMTSMGSMPLLSNDRVIQRSPSDKNRPHSLTSVDFDSLQQHAVNLQVNADNSTPPHSPSYTQTKSELTPFQTFKTMFKRKGSKNKGSKKRATSLSTTTNDEYSEALKKHFQKYDMS